MKSASHHVKKEIQDCPRHSPWPSFVVVVGFLSEKQYNKTIVDY